MVEGFEATDGIERTSSKFVITTVKNELDPIADYETETLLGLIEESADV